MKQFARIYDMMDPEVRRRAFREADIKSKYTAREGGIPMVGKRKKKEKPSPEEVAEALLAVLRQEKIRRVAEKNDISEEEAERILAGKKSKDKHR